MDQARKFIKYDHIVFLSESDAVAWYYIDNTDTLLQTVISANELQNKRNKFEKIINFRTRYLTVVLEDI